MNPTVTRFALAACAAAAVACNSGRDAAESHPPAIVTPGETAGTSGLDPIITIGGCLTRSQPDGFILTSIDDAIVGTTGTRDRHRNNPASAPEDPNPRAEQERSRHDLNPSAQAGRYRLEGNAERIAMHVNREVEVTGRVEAPAQNEIPATLHVETIDATGARCGEEQERGNDRGALPGQDLRRRPRG